MRGIGWVALVLGLVETLNFFVDPSRRIGWSLMLIRVLFFFGPLLLTVGLLLLLRTRNPGGQSRVLLGLGTLMLLPVAMLFVLLVFARSEMVGFYFTMSLVFLGLPGVAVLVAGITRRIGQD
jgi:hypothetical protein